MLPIISREIVYRLQEAALRRPTFAYLGELERSQWCSRAEIEALQHRKLAALLAVALKHSPWHAERIRAAGLDRSLPEIDVQQLQRLPVMDKRDAANNGPQIVWHGVAGGAYSYTTGGSSGQPLIFYYGRSRQASDAAGRMRARRWWGVEFGEPEVFLWGSPVELNKTDRIKAFRDRLLNQLVLNAFEMSVTNMDAYIEAIQAFNPVCIYGYASSLALLASRARHRAVRLRLPRLKVVCTTGEPLFPHQREIITEVFGVAAANEFGSRDSGFIAHEAPGGQMLVSSESTILEVLDPAGHPVAPGEMGEAVITGLCSEAQPFIRYRTGDMLRMSTTPCAQGRGLHVIKEVMGRTTDFIVRADGSIMHALAIIYVFRAIPGIAEFKFIQYAPERAEALVVPSPDWDESATNRIIAGVRARLGQEVKLEVKCVDKIPAEASGKHRYVVSHVRLPSGVAVAQNVDSTSGSQRDVSIPPTINS